jgi:hypothetical protein
LFAFTLIVLSGGLGWLGGCNPPDPSADSDGLGAIKFRLILPNGVNLDAIAYTITGPDAYKKTGTIPLDDSGTTEATIRGLPVGDGFNIVLSATGDDGRFKCEGAADFDVVADVTTAVDIQLLCPSTGGPSGTVQLDGVINVCATVEWVVATPSSDGKTVALHGLGSDQDSGPRELGYMWTASQGKLSSLTSADTVLTCPEGGGTVAVTLSVTDGACVSELAMSPVTCL